MIRRKNMFKHKGGADGLPRPGAPMSPVSFPPGPSTFDPRVMPPPPRQAVQQNQQSQRLQQLQQSQRLQQLQQSQQAHQGSSSSLQDAIYHLTEERDNAKKRNEALQQDIRTMVTQSRELEDSRDECLKAKEIIEQDLSIVQQALDQEKQKTSRNEGEIQRLTENQENLKKDKNQLEKEILELEDAIDELKVKYEFEDRENSRMEKKLAEYESEIVELSRQLSKATAEGNPDTIRQLREQLKQKEEELQSEQKEIEDLIKQRFEDGDAYEEAKITLEECKKARVALEEDKSILEKHLAELQEEIKRLAPTEKKDEEIAILRQELNQARAVHSYNTQLHSRLGQEESKLRRVARSKQPQLVASQLATVRRLVAKVDSLKRSPSSYRSSRPQRTPSVHQKQSIASQILQGSRSVRMSPRSAIAQLRGQISPRVAVRKISPRARATAHQTPLKRVSPRVAARSRVTSKEPVRPVLQKDIDVTDQEPLIDLDY